MRPLAAERFLPGCQACMNEASILWQQNDKEGVHQQLDKMLDIWEASEATEQTQQEKIQSASTLQAVGIWRRQLGSLEAARDTLEFASCRWSNILQSTPEDRYANTQLATCCNHFAIIDEAEAKWAAAEENYRAAAALRSHIFHHDEGMPDQAENLVYLGGVFCNLGYLYTQLKRSDDARKQFVAAIEFLKSAIKSAPVPLNDPEFQQWMDHWTKEYDQPHPMRVALSFLDNAEHGMRQLDR